MMALLYNLSYYSKLSFYEYIESNKGTYNDVYTLS